MSNNTADDLTVVHCPHCFRRESWSTTAPRTIQVHTEGGQRRVTQEHPLLILEILLSVLEHPQQHIVGRCPACDSPLISTSASLPTLPTWTLSLPDGDYDIGAQLTGPNGTLTKDEILNLFTQHYRKKWWSIQVGQSLFTTFLISSMAVPAIFIFCAFLSVCIFLTFFANPSPGP